MSFAELRQKVIDPGLCTRCGTCVGICPKHAVVFADPLGDCLPVGDDEACHDCDAHCVEACPGGWVDVPHLTKKVFGGDPEDYLLGFAPEIYVGNAADKDIRARAASGGVMTAILKHLLETGTVKGVACLIDDPAQPLLPKPVIVTNWETLKLSQQSKYSLAPMNTILHAMEQFDGPMAYVGLPDQVQSIRKLQMMGHPSTRDIVVILGSFCGAINHFSSVKEFLAKHGVHDLAEVVRIEYRAGAWPGKLRVTLQNGRRLELDKFYANYMTLFYVVERSLLCVDLSNELADISFGDAWAPRYEDRSEGFSLILVRSEAGRAVVEKCKKAGVLELDRTHRDDAIEMHSHGLFNKKIAVWSRIDIRQWLGKAVPNYGYRPVLPLKPRLVGYGIAIIFLLGRTRLARWIVQKLPLEVTGRIFLGIRKRWRGWTKPKRGRSLNVYKVVVQESNGTASPLKNK